MLKLTNGHGSMFPLLLSCLCFLNSFGFVVCGFTSSFIRTQWPAKDIPLDNEVFAVPKGYNAPQQVHITQGDYDGKAVIISWITFEEPGSNKVLYSSVEHQYGHTAEAKVLNYTYFNYKSGYIHHCLVDGLEYNAKYYYKIGLGDITREFWFQTPPKVDPDSSYKFGIIGNYYPSSTFNSLSTLDHHMKSGGQAVLYVGDLSYADRYQNNDGTRWDSWGRFVERSVAFQAWIWSAGNHEIEYRPDLGEPTPFKAYLHRYATPYMASKSSSPMWYAIRRASAHIIVLSSYSPFVKYTPSGYGYVANSSEWIGRDTLADCHHAFSDYNSNEAHYMEGESMRAVFEKWFVRQRVDLVFAGHVHAYERSYLVSNVNYNITNGDSFPVPNNLENSFISPHISEYPVYITVGDGGNQEGLAGRFLSPQPEYSAFREASYGHSTLELKNRTHAFYQWNRNDDGVLVQQTLLCF
ncbi:unnamed protein product [Spirodela intermedia]|uniref:Purple acid phosphatase n=1 Tax=Spirodela intermedia TaxID=51605 RepID=A0A7I8JIH8_SPIIN|nr:unnamed protein product [Spirodela intermedia]CAA6669957.1 unnamed protein product [Spirodela intermedia]